jgi:hypothetical protein
VSKKKAEIGCRLIGRPLGTPPLVVQPPSSEPRREASSFLSKVPAIIPFSIASVKPDRSFGLCWSFIERSINVTSHLVSPRGSSDLIIYLGPKTPYSDHPMWPMTPSDFVSGGNEMASASSASRHAFHPNSPVIVGLGSVFEGSSPWREVDNNRTCQALEGWSSQRHRHIWNCCREAE